MEGSVATMPAAQTRQRLPTPVHMHRFQFRTPGQAFQQSARFPMHPSARMGLKQDTTSAMNMAHGMTFDGKRMRKSMQRKTIDYYTTVLKYLQNRVWQRGPIDRRAVQPDCLYHYDLLPPASLLEEPMNCVTTKFMRQATNKFKCPIFSLCWTPEGRRLVTGASSGEFTLWNGLAFNFETILQAHDSAVRAMEWSHNDNWMVTADHNGFIKYWQSNMNNVKMFQAHRDPIRDLSFCPTDSKFTSCSDDGTVRIWDFLHCHEERVLRGHGADVKTVAWHPHKSLIVSGSKDAQQPVKLWDPRTGQSLSTIHVHKNTVMDVEWNRNGNWLLTASRDHSCKLFDIRNLKEEFQTFKGHKKEVSCVSWNPIHENLFASGGSDGAILFWLVGNDKELGSIDQAHDNLIWTMEWHPMGHVLATGANDHSTKFWSRNRPGDNMKDKYNLNVLPSGVSEELSSTVESIGIGEHQESEAVIPGMGLEHGIPEDFGKKGIPGFGEGSNYRERRIIHTKKIPQQFQKAWEGGLQPQMDAPQSERKVLLGDAPPGMVQNGNPHFEGMPPPRMPFNQAMRPPGMRRSILGDGPRMPFNPNMRMPRMQGNMPLMNVNPRMGMPRQRFNNNMNQQQQQHMAQHFQQNFQNQMMNNESANANDNVDSAQQDTNSTVEKSAPRKGLLKPPDAPAAPGEPPSPLGFPLLSSTVGKSTNVKPTGGLLQPPTSNTHSGGGLLQPPGPPLPMGPSHGTMGQPGKMGPSMGQPGKMGPPGNMGFPSTIGASGQTGNMGGLLRPPGPPGMPGGMGVKRNWEEGPGARPQGRGGSPARGGPVRGRGGFRGGITRGR